MTIGPASGTTLRNVLVLLLPPGPLPRTGAELLKLPMFSDEPMNSPFFTGSFFAEFVDMFKRFCDTFNVFEFSDVKADEDDEEGDDDEADELSPNDFSDFFAAATTPPPPPPSPLPCSDNSDVVDADFGPNCCCTLLFEATVAFDEGTLFSLMSASSVAL